MSFESSSRIERATWYPVDSVNFDVATDTAETCREAVRRAAEKVLHVHVAALPALLSADALQSLPAHAQRELCAIAGLFNRGHALYFDPQLQAPEPRPLVRWLPPLWRNACDAVNIIAPQSSNSDGESSEHQRWIIATTSNNVLLNTALRTIFGRMLLQHPSAVQPFALLKSVVDRCKAEATSA
jgi:hypothetical protein